MRCVLRQRVRVGHQCVVSVPRPSRIVRQSVVCLTLFANFALCAYAIFVPAPSTLAVNGSTLGTRRRRLPLDPRAHPSFASERTHEQRSASWKSLESFIQFTSFCSSCTLPDNSKIVFWSSMSFRLASVSNVELWKFS